MPVSIPYSFSNGTIIEASEMNSNFTAVKNFVDGVAAGTNITDGAIVTAKLATNAVTTEKINDGSITSAKLAAGVGTTGGDSSQIVLGVQVFG